MALKIDAAPSFSYGSSFHAPSFRWWWKSLPAISWDAGFYFTLHAYANLGRLLMMPRHMYDIKEHMCALLNAGVRISSPPSP